MEPSFTVLVVSSLTSPFSASIACAFSIFFSHRERERRLGGGGGGGGGMEYASSDEDDLASLNIRS